MEANRLPPDGRGRFEFIHDFQPVRRAGQRSDRRPLQGHLDRLADDQRLGVGILLDDAGLLDRLDKGAAAAVPAWQFAHRSAGDAHDSVIDSHAGQCRHAMLDGFHEQRSIAQAGPARAVEDILHQGGDGRHLPVLFADEGDAGTRLAWRERQRRGLAGKQSGTGQRCFAKVSVDARSISKFDD